MGCPNLQFNSSSFLSMFNPISGGGPVQVGSDAEVQAQATNPGGPDDFAREGTILFSWQQTGLGAPIVPLPADIGCVNPAQIWTPSGSQYVGPGANGVGTTIWKPSTAIVGTGNPAKGYLWATVSTTAIANECSGNSPAPGPNSPYSISIFTQIRGASAAMRTASDRLRVTGAPDLADQRIFVGFAIGHGRGSARVLVAARKGRGLVQADLSVSAFSVGGAPIASGTLGPEEQHLVEVHDSKRRSPEAVLELERGASLQGVLCASFPKGKPEYARSLVSIALIVGEGRFERQVRGFTMLLDKDGDNHEYL